MGWDKDGTLCWWAYSPGEYGSEWTSVDTGTITVFSEAQMGNLNDEATTAAPNIVRSSPGGKKDGFIVHIFPELRDLYGFHAWAYNPDTAWYRFHVLNFQTSTDTTNGIDGNWTEHFSETTQWWNSDLSPTLMYRSSIDTYSALGVRSVRYVINTEYDLSGDWWSWYSSHHYGDISSGETPDRLLFIDSGTGLEFTAPEDWGDVPRGTVLSRTMTVKNNSSTLTATTNTLSFEALTGTSNTWYTADESGGGYSSPLSLTSPLTAGSSTGTITVKLTVPIGAALSLAAARAYLTVGTWS
jgi:hypothetical protein